MFLHKQLQIYPGYNPIGSAEITTSPVKFGSGALSVNFAGSGIGGVQYTVGSRTWGDFTMEGWFRPTYTSNGFYTAMQWANLRFRFRYVNSTTCEIYYEYFTAGSWNAFLVASGNFYNTYRWCAFVGTGSQYRYYNAASGSTDTANSGDPASPIYVPNNVLNVSTRTSVTVGCSTDESSGFAGFIDSVRISTIARYTNVFTQPSPTTQFVKDANTWLLCNYNGSFDNEVI